MSSYSVQKQWTISQLDCEVRWKVYFIWQPVMTSSVVGLRRSSRTLPKAKVAPEKFMVTIWWSACIWSTTPFWIPANPLHLRSMLSKSAGSIENCNTCSWHWLTEWAQFFSAIRPDCTLHNQRFKSWTSWAMKCCFICHFHLTSHQPTIPSSSISTTFCREKSSTTKKMQKMLSKNPLNSKAHIFILQE